MPSAIGFILSKVPAHFSRSSIRREEFLELQKAMEAGNPEDLSTPFERYVETRWLARYNVMIIIHKNWDTLKWYFELIIPNLSLGQKFEVKALLDMMKDESNHLLMAFLIPIVGEFEKLNAMFQATGSADAENAYDALEKCVRSLRKRVMIPGTQAYLPVQEADLGVSFKTMATGFIHSHINREESEKIVNDLKRRCFGFLTNLLTETDKRLPPNIDVFRKIKLFSPSSLFKNSPPQFADLPFTKDMELEEQGEIEQQYRLVLDENWSENSPFKELEVRYKEVKKYLP